MFLRLVAVVLRWHASNSHARPPSISPPDPSLNALFDREFSVTFRNSPKSPPSIGIEGHDDRLHDASALAVARRRLTSKSVLVELAAFDPANLSAQDRISHSMMVYDLRRQDALNAIYGNLRFGAGSDGWLPINPVRRTSLRLSFARQGDAPFEPRATTTITSKRLDALPLLIQQVTQIMQAGMKSGWMPPRAAMVRAPGQITPFAVPDVTASPLSRAVQAVSARRPGGWTQQRITDCRAQDCSRIACSPSLRRCSSLSETKYLPACSE